MKSFKEYITTTNADVARQYMNLRQKSKEGPLNPFDETKLKAMKNRLTDPMITRRKKVDAAGLVTTRSGAKGGSASGNGGGSGGGSGSGGGGGSGGGAGT